MITFKLIFTIILFVSTIIFIILKMKLIDVGSDHGFYVIIAFAVAFVSFWMATLDVWANILN